MNEIVTDEIFNLKIKNMDNPQLRYGSRGIILDKNKIAILYKKNKGEYKLIGGGLENEDKEEGFIREALEETGCEIEIDEFLGTITEEHSQTNFKQVSYVFTAHIKKKISEPKYTEEELEDGSTLLWISIKEALELIKERLTNINIEKEYNSAFILKRDLTILNYYAKMHSNINN